MRLFAVERLAMRILRLSGAAATTSDQPILRDVQQRLNGPVSGSIGDNHYASVRLQVFQFERGHFNEAMSPVGCDASLTLDDLAAPADALDHSIRAVHPDNLIDTGSAVGIQPIHRDGHRVPGCHQALPTCQECSRNKSAGMNEV